MNNSIVLTIISEDRPGIVQKVSSTLSKHGGNWTQSSMSTLAGQFAGILLASVPATSADACLADLRDLEDQGIHLTAEICDDAPVTGKTWEYSLELVGNDQPDIVHTITKLLANHQISVQEFESSVESGSMAGGSIFRAQAKLHVPETIDIGDLETELEALA
ncbi:MAG: glycine cleavage system regulatory protein, partial [Rhodothermales bacterium]